MNLIISIILGAVIGLFFNIKDKILDFNSKFQFLLLIFLLFFMGLSIGANERIINNLGTIGLASFTYALLTTLLSVIFVFFIGKIIIKEH
jgi:uncharacterized transporter YbjL